MKNNSILFIISIIMLTPNLLFGQCVANAGNDTALCDFNEIQLGGNPSVFGGQAPYTYRWYIEPIEILGHTFTASDFLNDITLSNPILTENGSDMFILEVTDANNETCKDTIKIYSPNWMITLDQKIREVQKNTPVALYTSVYSESSILSYLWSPTIGLSNPNIVNPIATLEESITYNLLITDSAGCEMSDVFYIIINDTQINYNQTDNNKILINETDENFICEITDFNNKYVTFYNVIGEKIKIIKFTANQLIVNKTEFKSGIYIFKLTDNNDVLKTGKITIN